ncbi:MAG: DNA polymerase III subunit beta [Acidimicrobiales bacterium]
MELTIERDTLLSTLTTASRALGTRLLTSAGLGGMHILVTETQLVATCTDRDLTIIASTDVVATDPGEVLVPGRLAVEIVRSLEPSAVVLRQVAGTELEVVSGNSSFSIRCMEADLFPKTDVGLQNDRFVEIPVSELSTTINQVVRAASTDDSRPVLTGILMSPTVGGMTVVGTDSYRLAIGTVKYDDPDSVLAEPIVIPARALAEVKRILASPPSGHVPDEMLRLSALGSTAYFSYMNTAILARLVEGRFPDYGKLIPSSYAHELSFEAEPMQQALRRMKLLVQDNKTPIRLEVSDDLINVRVTSDDIGSAVEEVSVTYSGEPFEIAFNGSYLSDGIDAINEDTIVIKTADAGKPSLLQATKENSYQYLLMPIRII